MDKQNYKELLKNTFKYDSANYNSQKIINKLKMNDIVTYKKNDSDKIVISTEDSVGKRVSNCIDANDNSIFQIEKYNIEKAYRYSIYFSCNEFEINNEKINNYIKIEDFNSKDNSNIDDYLKPRYFEDENKIVFIFVKNINKYVENLDKSVNILYPTLWIYHKKMKILEHRFNLIGFKSNDDFYKTTFMPQLDRLNNDFKIIVKEFRTSKIIKYIIENKKDEVHEISQYMGLKGDSSAKLKVGKNLIMPFIGDIEMILEENVDLFNKNNETKKIRDILNNYIVNTKENANYKSRLLSWYRNGEKEAFLNVNVMFSYKDNKYDVLNFLQPKKNDMEMMDYAIKYLWGAAKSINTTN